ncbi:MAG: hypothetical protein MJZ20_14240 [Bacteroidaceae bacterium]|nr:hypothetical protein [Bacteroidaceae bacterium]
MMSNDSLSRFIATLMYLTITLNLFAVRTTYTFVGIDWSSKIGTVKLDSKTDGWVSNKNATDYNAGYTDAQGRLYNCGVGTKTSTSGAGATSVLNFNNVSRIVVNYCQNSSKGKGSINIQVGDNAKQSLTIMRPQTSGSGMYNRDTEFIIDNHSGKITFSVDCTENSIYINTITIYADNGSSHNPDQGDDVMWVVTDPSELQTGDIVMFGVSNPNVNLVMGYFDESKSQHNIRAEKATYSQDRTIVNRINPAFEYTVERRGDDVAFLDAAEWYLVANGGNPNKGNNNYLAVWDKAVSDSYGDFGYWHISIADDYSAKITNIGHSRSNTIMYNPNKTAGTDIFACYSDTSHFTLPVIYKLHGKNATAPNIITTDFEGHETKMQILDNDEFCIVDGDYKEFAITRNINNVRTTYLRTFLTDNLQAIYLPLSLSITNDLADFNVYAIQSVTSSSINLTHLTSGMTEANAPYIIQPKYEGSHIITPANKTLNATHETIMQTSQFDIIGTYHTITFGDINEDWYALKDGKFVKAASGATLLPFRFYIKVPKTALVKETLDINVNNEVDEISLPKNNLQQNSTTTYDISGKKINPELNHTTLGLYIINGRKTPALHR